MRDATIIPLILRPIKTIDSKARKPNWRLFSRSSVISFRPNQVSTIDYKAIVAKILESQDLDPDCISLDTNDFKILPKAEFRKNSAKGIHLLEPDESDIEHAIDDFFKHGYPVIYIYA